MYVSGLDWDMARTVVRADRWCIQGPCELWIDDTRVWHYDDCRGSFPEYPAKIPTDYSACKGNCLVSFYWLALHSPQWQIYSASRRV